MVTGFTLCVPLVIPNGTNISGGWYSYGGHTMNRLAEDTLECFNGLAKHFGLTFPWMEDDSQETDAAASTD
jgi:hypothetical protein